MNITFRPLSECDFQTLLTWLEIPHVKSWWDSDVSWTIEKVRAKYQSYVAQYKLEQGDKKPIYAFIIEVDGQDAGYIQFYRARDFLTVPDLPCFPFELAAIDFYIGEAGLLGLGLGARALSQFIKEIVFSQFQSVVVTPDTGNVAAIACYQKAGFKQVLIREDLKESWLLFNK